jgi:hypothetical protein
MAAAAGVSQALNSFMGWGPTATSKQDASIFISRLGEAIREAIQKSELSTRTQEGDQLSSGLFTSLKQGATVDLNRGIPRLVLLSDLSTYFGAIPGTAEQARQFGLDAGESVGLNLSGSELYVVGTTGNAKPSLNDALQTFFLTSRASLVSISGASSMPVFLGNPVRLIRYQGLVQFPTTRYPVRIRLLSDQNGTLINSWFGVQAQKEEYTPIRGTLTCNDGGCTFAGDNTFAQVWRVKRDANGAPMFDKSMPFGGARTLQFVTKDNYLKGDISDPSVQFTGLKSNKLHFYATTSQGMF